MIYDVPSRHQQALDPSALTNICTTLYAIEKALADCRNAGVDPNSDPAVVLLARHMATVSSNRAPRAVLQAACNRRLDLRRFPTLLSLAIRGVENNAAAKEQFHIDGRRAMARLAGALALEAGTYEVRSFLGTPAESGYVILAAPDLAVMMRVGARFQGREVAYRAVVGGLEQHNRYAQISDLLKAERFAARLRRELGLEAPFTVLVAHAAAPDQAPASPALIAA